MRGSIAALSAMAVWSAAAFMAWPAAVEARGLGGRVAARPAISRVGPASSGSIRAARASAPAARPVTRPRTSAVRIAGGAPRYRYRSPGHVGSAPIGARGDHRGESFGDNPAARYRRNAYISNREFGALPCSRRSVGSGSRTYYRCGAAWYYPVYYYGDVYYAEVWPPAGVEAETLPAGSQTVIAGSTTYYLSDDAFYEKSDDGGYVTVEPPVGTRLGELPAGAAKAIPIVAGGATYYHYHGVYYRQVDDADGRHYEISANPFQS